MVHTNPAALMAFLLCLQYARAAEWGCSARSGTFTQSTDCINMNQVDINGHLSITGKENTHTTLSAKDGQRHFYVRLGAYTLTLKWLKMINGSPGGGGGSILYYISGRLDVTSCIFYQNSVEAFHGGAIYAKDAQNSPQGKVLVSLTRTQFIENSAVDNGGAVYLNYGTLKSEDTAYVENTAKYGGAMSLYYLEVGSTISNDLISNNEATRRGGGIHIYGSSNYPSRLSISRATFRDNKQTTSQAYSYGGGAVYLMYGNFVSVRESTFIRNEAIGGSSNRDHGHQIMTCKGTTTGKTPSLTLVNTNFTNIDDTENNFYGYADDGSAHGPHYYVPPSNCDSNPCTVEPFTGACSYDICPYGWIMFEGKYCYKEGYGAGDYNNANYRCYLPGHGPDRGGRTYSACAKGADVNYGVLCENICNRTVGAVIPPPDYRGDSAGVAITTTTTRYTPTTGGTGYKCNECPFGSESLRDPGIRGGAVEGCKVPTGYSTTDPVSSRYCYCHGNPTINGIKMSAMPGSGGQDCRKYNNYHLAHHDGTYAGVDFNFTLLRDYCNLCPKNYYCPAGTNPPIPCPGGRSTSGLGAKTLGECNNDCSGAGEFVDSDQCTSCPKDYYCPDGTNISIPCPGSLTLGRGAKTLGECYDCSGAGEFAGPGQCTLCPKNYYCPAGVRNSTVCPAGTFTYAEGADKCETCPEGHYCTGGASEPKQCGFDRFSNLQVCDFQRYKSEFYDGFPEGYDEKTEQCVRIGNRYVDKCGITPNEELRLGELWSGSFGICRDTFRNFASVCNRLGSKAGSTSESDCTFNQTVYSCVSNDVTGQRADAEGCMPGTNCNSFFTTKSYASLNCDNIRGSFKPDKDSSISDGSRQNTVIYYSPLRMCTNCKYKKWCPGGPTSACLHNRSGFGCKDCPKGFYNLNDGCAPCPVGAENSFQWFAGLLAIVAYFAYLYKELGRKKRKPDEDDEQSTKLSNGTHKGPTKEKETKATVGPKKSRRSSKMGANEQKLSGGTLARIGILLSHVTSINLILPSVTLPHIPPIIKMSFMNFFSFISVDISGMVTSPECQMEMETETKVHFNAGLPLVIIFACWVWGICLRRRNRPKGKDMVREGDDRVLAVLLHIYVVNMYILILDKIFTPFDCTMKYGTWDEDPTYQCGEIIGRSMFPVALYLSFYIIFPTIYILDNAYGVDVCRCPYTARQEYSEDVLLKKERIMRMTKSRRNSWWGKQRDTKTGPQPRVFSCFKHCTCCRKRKRCQACFCLGCRTYKESSCCDCNNCACCNEKCKCGDEFCSKKCGDDVCCGSGKHCGKYTCNEFCSTGCCCGCTTKCCSACCIRGCAIFCRGCKCCCCKNGCWDEDQQELDTEEAEEKFCCPCGCCCSNINPCCCLDLCKIKDKKYIVSGEPYDMNTGHWDNIPSPLKEDLEKLSNKNMPSSWKTEIKTPYVGPCTKYCIYNFFPLALFYLCCPLDRKKVYKNVSLEPSVLESAGNEKVQKIPFVIPNGNIHVYKLKDADGSGVNVHLKHSPWMTPGEQIEIPFTDEMAERSICPARCCCCYCLCLRDVDDESIIVPYSCANCCRYLPDGRHGSCASCWCCFREADQKNDKCLFCYDVKYLFCCRSSSNATASGCCDVPAADAGPGRCCCLLGDDDDDTLVKRDCATCCRRCCSKRCYKKWRFFSWFWGVSLFVFVAILGLSGSPAYLNVLVIMLACVIVAAPSCKRYNTCSHEELTEREETNRYLDRFGWLFLKYNPDRFYWEMVVVVRKVLMLLVAKFLTNVPVWSMPLQCVIIVGSVCLQKRHMPYVDDCPAERAGKWDFDANNRLEIVFLVAQLALVMGEFANGWMASGDDVLYTQTELDEKYPAVSMFATIFEWVGIVVLFLGTVYFFTVHGYHAKIKLIAKRKEKKEASIKKMRRKSTMNPFVESRSGLEALEKRQQERPAPRASVNVEMVGVKTTGIFTASDTVTNPLFKKKLVVK